MATIWKETSESFVAHPLAPAGAPASVGESGPDGDCQRYRVVALRDGGQPWYALLVGSGTPARVNGSPVVGGIRVLQHKDELVLGSSRMLFSAESTPVVEVFRHTGSRRRPRCPICRNEVLDQQSVVRCPGCSRIFHEMAASDATPEKRCWTYSSHCRFCDHPTSLSGEPSWCPVAEFGR